MFFIYWPAKLLVAILVYLYFYITKKRPFKGRQKRRLDNCCTNWDVKSWPYICHVLKDLKIRKWKCPECGKVHDRDINASKNILNEGLKIQKAS